MEEEKRHFSLLLSLPVHRVFGNNGERVCVSVCARRGVIFLQRAPSISGPAADLVYFSTLFTG